MGNEEHNLIVAHYQGLETLTDYLPVAQDTVRIEHFARLPDGQWLLSECSALQDTVDLPAIACRLLLSEVYDKVEFGAAE